MKRKYVQEYIVPDWSLPALLRNDFSGLNKIEKKDVRDFVEYLKDECDSLRVGGYGFGEIKRLGMWRDNDMNHTETKCSEIEIVFMIDEIPEIRPDVSSVNFGKWFR